MQMDVRPIRTEADYDWALAEIAPYFEREPDRETADGARFDVLAALIDRYEAAHWAIEGLGPVETLHATLEQRGATQRDLAELLGSRSRASEVLSGKRALTAAQAMRINEAWGAPLDALLRPAEVETA